MESVSLEVLKIRQCLFYGRRSQDPDTKKLAWLGCRGFLTKIIETLLQVSHTRVAF